MSVTVYTYYELRGLEPQTKMPSGMFRVVETKDKLWYERVSMEGEWVVDNSLVRYIAGYADSAEKTTKGKAEKFVKYLKSGQAAKDKKKGKWK